MRESRAEKEYWAKQADEKTQRRTNNKPRFKAQSRNLEREEETNVELLVDLIRNNGASGPS